MNTDRIFPSKYLKAGDLPEEGTLKVTIEKVTLEDVGRDKERKPVIHFEELDKALICNKTNATTITKLTHSKETDDWIGAKINLYRAEVEFQGEMIESIRISFKQQTGSIPHERKPVATTSDDDPDEIPF